MSLKQQELSEGEESVKSRKGKRLVENVSPFQSADEGERERYSHLAGTSQDVLQKFIHLRLMRETKCNVEMLKCQSKSFCSLITIKVESSGFRFSH